MTGPRTGCDNAAAAHERVTRQKRGQRYDYLVLDCPHDLVLPVACFADGPLREAFAVYWMPFPHPRGCKATPQEAALIDAWEKFSHGHDAASRPRQPPVAMARAGRYFTNRWPPRVRPAWSAALHAATRDVDRENPRCREKADRPASLIREVRIVLDSSNYLNEDRTRVFDLDLARLGDVFGFAHDMYREAYKDDAKRGGGAHCSDHGSKVVNRCAGPVIWGHDFGDLVFEQVFFRPLPKDPDGAVAEFRFGVGS